MADLRMAAVLGLLLIGAQGARQVGPSRSLQDTTQLMDSEVGLGNYKTNYGGTGVKAYQSDAKKTSNGEKSIVTGEATGNTLTAFGTTQVGTFQYAAVGNGTAPLLSGEGGVILGGYPVGLSASTANPIPSVVTEISHPAVDYAGLVKSPGSKTSDPKSSDPETSDPKSEQPGESGEDDDSSESKPDSDQTSSSKSDSEGTSSDSEKKSESSDVSKEDAYTRINTEAGRRLRFVASPPQSTSGYSLQIGEESLAELLGNFQTYAGPNKQRSEEAGYTAGLAFNAINQTLGGDFLNGRITNNIEQSPLPIVAGQGGLVVANQPGGVGLSTANLFSPEVISNFTQIYLPAVEFIGRRLQETSATLTAALKNPILEKFHKSATNP